MRQPQFAVAAVISLLVLTGCQNTNNSVDGSGEGSPDETSETVTEDPDGEEDMDGYGCQ